MELRECIIDEPEAAKVRAPALCETSSQEGQSKKKQATSESQIQTVLALTPFCNLRSFQKCILHKNKLIDAKSR